MTKFKVTLAGLALGVAAAVALSGLARADMVKCQAGLEKNVGKIESTILGTLVKVSDALRKGPINLKLAATLEKDLVKTYDGVAGAIATKYRPAIEALLPGTCSASDLQSLGFLLSGGGSNCAPGTNAIKFTEDVLLVQAEQEAFNTLIAEAPLFDNLLLQMQQVVVCPNLAYPNLCNLKVECAERVCNLGTLASSTSLSYTTSWALGTPGHPSTAVSTLNDSSTMGMCFMDGDIKGTEPGFAYMTGTTGRELDVLNLGGGIYVCIDTLRANGYCDCAGAGTAQKQIFDCMDRRSEKTCGGPPTSTSVGNDACGSPCSAQQADASYQGSYNGLPNIACSVATVAGDCVEDVTNQFIVVTGPLYGTDGKPCTSDDTGGVNSPTTVILTTGQSQSEIKNPVQKDGYGTCDTDGATACVDACYNVCVNKFCTMLKQPGSVSVACKKDTDCDSLCNGTVQDPDTTGRIETGARPPAGSFPYASGCELYRQNHMAGLTLSGTFPGSASADNGGLGDNLNAFNESCQ